MSSRLIVVCRHGSMVLSRVPQEWLTRFYSSIPYCDVDVICLRCRFQWRCFAFYAPQTPYKASYGVVGTRTIFVLGRPDYASCHDGQLKSKTATFSKARRIIGKSLGQGNFICKNWK